MAATLRLGIVSGRYNARTIEVEGEEVPITTLELFGRSENGQSVCVLVNGQRPTFEISSMREMSLDEKIPDEIQMRLERVRAMDEVVDVTGPVLKLTDLGKRPVWTVEASQPFKVSGLRSKLGASSWTVFSGDIPFLNRLFLNNNLGMHVEVTGEVLDRRDDLDEDGDVLEKILANGGTGRYPVDITMACQLEELKQTAAFPVPFKIFSFDLETSIEHDTILCGAAWIENLGDGSRQSFEFVGDERKMMEEMTRIVRVHDPDIITGYNIDNFDMPRMQSRMEEHVRAKDWRGKSQLFGWGRTGISESEAKRSRDGLLPKRQSNRAWNLAGRAVVDAWWQARMALRPQRETLKYISNLLFPDNDELQKIDIDASNMDEEWASRPDEVLEYCVRDAQLPLDILHEIQAIRRKEAVAAVAKVSFETACNGSTSQLIDSLVIRLADSKNVAVPLTGSAEAKEGQITGGYVHDVAAGLYPWISVLDFKSMYPSIMIGHNICYTTRIDPAQSDQPVEGALVHTAPNGARFRHQDDRKGLVPYLLEDLMRQRDEHKAGMKDARENEDDQAYSFHDSMQYAVKILMNSFYGVFASGFYRFTHKDLGSSITAWARHNIKGIISNLEQEGHAVVYSDTDSIFVQAPVDSSAPSVLKDDSDDETIASFESAKQQMVDFGIDLAERFSRDSAVLEFEKGLSVFFSHGAKKRYVGQVVWPNDEMLIRGYETQRTDSFAYLRDTMKQMFTYALSDEGEELINYALERVRAVKNHEVDASQLVLSKTCKGRIAKDGSIDFTKDYVNPDSMASVRVAKMRIAMGLGFTPGMKVAYIVDNASNRPMSVVPWLEGEEDGGISSYDGLFYAERLAGAIGRITEAFGWNAKELVSGNRQTSLFSF